MTETNEMSEAEIEAELDDLLAVEQAENEAMYWLEVSVENPDL